MNAERRVSVLCCPLTELEGFSPSRILTCTTYILAVRWVSLYLIRVLVSGSRLEYDVRKYCCGRHRLPIRISLALTDTIDMNQTSSTIHSPSPSTPDINDTIGLLYVGIMMAAVYVLSHLTPPFSVALIRAVPQAVRCNIAPGSSLLHPIPSGFFGGTESW